MAAGVETRIDSLLVSKPGFRDGRPCLRGTGITVHNVAAAHLNGHTAEELCEENSDLDPSLVHAALAYYFANRERVERELEEDRMEGEALAREFPHGMTRDTMRLP